MKSVIRSKSNHARRGRKKTAVVGLGKFVSSVAGLGSNKKHLRRYGS
jgi:hypothetical protein